MNEDVMKAKKREYMRPYMRRQRSAAKVAELLGEGKEAEAEASLKYGVSTRHLRHLLTEKKLIQGQRFKISSTRDIFLIEEASLKRYLKHRPKPGPKPAK